MKRFIVFFLVFLSSVVVGQTRPDILDIKRTPFYTPSIIGTGAVTNSYGLRLQTLNTAGTISNIWGIYQETAAARNYYAGRTLFGTTTDDGVSAVQVAGGGLRLVGAAAPATPAEGTLYFNSTDKHFYGYNGTAWVQLDN